MADTFGTVSACVGMGSTCGGCGPESTIRCEFSGRSDLQEVCVKGSEVARDLVDEFYG
jgi:hypothetical protein